MYDVITIGAATIDVFLRSDRIETHPSPAGATGVAACVPLGAKIELDELYQETGGGATNAAATFAKMGHRTAVIAAIGDDANGAIIRKELAGLRISTSMLRTMKGVRTGYSAILLTHSGERTVLVFRGAASKLRLSSAQLARHRAKWLYVSSLAGDLASLRTALAHAKRIGAKVAWNPGGKEIAHGFRTLEPLVKRVDVLILNREEAARLAVTDQSDLAFIVKHLSSHPKLALVVTDGQNGAYVFNGAGGLHCPSLTKKRVNTTGAGDAFGSGFVAGLLKKPGDVRYALGVAACNAASVIGAMGAKRGILSTCPGIARIEKLTIRPWK